MSEQPKSGFITRIKSLPCRIGDRIGPALRTRRGTSFSAALFAVGLGAFLGTQLRTGEGVGIDAGIGAGITLLIILLTPIALGLAIRMVRMTSATIGSIGLGAFVASLYILDRSLPFELALAGAIGIVLLGALTFGAFAAFTSATEKGALKKTWLTLCLLCGVGGFGFAGWWILDRGSDEDLVRPELASTDQKPPAQLTAPNPGEEGLLEVQTLTYGSGTDRRPEFGEKAALKTESVNGKPFAKMPSGWKGDLRKRYWGFDNGRLPLNGRVWYPEGDGPFPLVLVVHGNHMMTEHSDPGYEYLGKHLASHGFILVSVDENFLNSGGLVFGRMSKENDCRGWVLLKHLEVWRTWNETAGNPFHNKVDMDKIGLIGHSRGGESVGHAALFNTLTHYPEDASVRFDFGFSIRAVISIAPSDGQYRPASRYAVLRDVNFFTIQGGHDTDVSSFVGDRIYQRLQFTKGGGDFFKASLFVYRANHGQFNEVWGDMDSSPPRGLLINRGALLPGDEQRKIAKVFFGGFLEATLHGKREYIALFRDPRCAGDWVPDTPMISRFQDSKFSTVTDFDDDFDVTTIDGGGQAAAANLVVWREGDIKLRSGSRRYNSGVFLGWNAEKDEEKESGTGKATNVVEAVAEKPASYEITLPASAKPGTDSILVLDIGVSAEKPEAKDYEVKDDDEVDKNKDKNKNEEQKDTEKKDEDSKKAKALDFTIELVAADGSKSSLPLSRFGVLWPPLSSKFTRTSYSESRYKKDEPNLQTFELPLSAFAAAVPAFQPQNLTKIRFVFDRSEKGVIVLDRIGFARN